MEKSSSSEGHKKQSAVAQAVEIPVAKQLPPPPPLPAVVASTKKADSSKKPIVSEDLHAQRLFLFSVAVYVLTLSYTYCYFNFGRYQAAAPMINRSNAIEVVHRRLGELEKQFERALQTANWTTIQTAENYTSQRLELDGASYYREIVILPMTPEGAVKTAHHQMVVAAPMNVISNWVMFQPSDTVLIMKKLYHWPLVIPRNVMTFAFVEQKLDHAVTVAETHIENVTEVQSTTTIPRGTAMSASVLVNFDHDEILGRKEKKADDSEVKDDVPLSPIASSLKANCNILAYMVIPESSPSPCDSVIRSADQSGLFNVTTYISGIKKLIRIVQEGPPGTQVGHDMLSYMIPLKSGGTLLVGIYEETHDE